MPKKVKIRKKLPLVGFAGSLIQQNHGESADSHGFLVWNLEEKKIDGVDIENDYGYYTIDIENGVIPYVENIPCKPRLRVRIKNTNHTEIHDLISEIRSKFQPVELSVNRIHEGSLFDNNDIGDDLIGDILNVDIQNNLIGEYLKSSLSLKPEVINTVKAINTEVNAAVDVSDLKRNVRWIPKRFEFNNMFSYGRNNVIDFSNMHGIYGIFAPNASGKSSIMSALSFCLFDKSDRAFKASHILNNRRGGFSCKFNFEIEGTDFFIERVARKNNKGDVSVKVNFWYIDDLGEEISLNGAQRRDTNHIIENYIGTYDDFVLTALSLQNNNTLFIDKSQSEKKDLLAQFLGINIFDRLYTEANEKRKELKLIISEYEKVSHEDIISESIEKIKKLSKEENELSIKIEKTQTELQSVSSQIYELAEKLIPISKSIREESSITSDIKLLESKRDDLINQNQSLRNDLASLTADVESQKNKLFSIDIDYLYTKENKFDLLKDDLNKITTMIGKLDVQIKIQEEKLVKLDKLEYDPNCTYCMNNIFVKDAIDTKETLKKNLTLRTDILEKKKHLLEQISEVESVKDEIKNYNTLSSDIHRKEIKISGINNTIYSNESKITDCKSKIIALKDELNQYYEHKEALKYNQFIQKQINELKNGQVGLEGDLRYTTGLILDINRKLSVTESRKQEAEKNSRLLSEMQERFYAYDYYITAVKRNGVPYEIIKKILPVIEEESNNILNQIVDFSVVFEPDEKNINIQIVYDEDQSWPLSLGSGMEKFVSSLAIRSALMTTSAIPRPNFLAIDEGFGSLDHENISSISMLFDYLKTQYEFILIVSHLDAMRDIVDNQIEIKKVGGFSNIVYES